MSTPEQEYRWATVDSMTDARLAEYLAGKGYLVLSPSDTSPVAELVRAACNRGPTPQGRWVRVMDQADAVAQDPSVRAWVERGR